MPHFMFYGMYYIYFSYEGSNKDICYPVSRVLSMIMLLGSFYFMEFIMLFILWNNWNQMEAAINIAVF